MKLVDVLRKECIVANAALASKDQALSAVAHAAKRSTILADVSEEQVLQALQDREALGSTGFGKGIAIPHCRLEAVRDFVVGIITAPDGVDFDALDGQKVTLIVFIVGPAGGATPHIKLLSAISQTLQRPEVVEEIISQGSPEGIYSSFLRHTPVDITTKEHPGYSLINVIVQDERVFKDVLQALTAVPSSSLFVINAENTSAYLAKMPLFAEFWRDRSMRFCKVIMTVVQSGLVNEAVRLIETVTGNLHEREGVMVTVQPLTYATGSLAAQL